MSVADPQPAARAAGPLAAPDRTPAREGMSLSAAAFYHTIRTIAATYFMLFHRPRVFHKGRVPARGPFLIAANHQSFLDPPLIGCWISWRYMSYVARGGLFRNPAFARFISAVNALPIREDGKGDAAAIKEVLRRLASGGGVVIFPEGSRSETGAMEEFKRGVAVLVKRAACPVVPAAVEGCFDAWPRGRRFPRLWGAPVAVMYGRPIPHAELMREGPDAALARLAREIEHMRLQLRAILREESHGSYPAPGPGDVMALAPFPPPGPSNAVTGPPVPHAPTVGPLSENPFHVPADRAGQR